MKSFLCKKGSKKPFIKWGMLPDNIFYEGIVPEGYDLAISLWGNKDYVVVDVDRHGKKDGFDHIPQHLKEELSNTLHYPTKNNGMHFWFKYTGDVKLANKASNQGIDLRTNRGYVIWYPKGDIRDNIQYINDTSIELNKWLKVLFGYKTTKKNNDGITR